MDESGSVAVEAGALHEAGSLHFVACDRAGWTLHVLGTVDCSESSVVLLQIWGATPMEI